MNAKTRIIELRVPMPEDEVEQAKTVIAVHEFTDKLNSLAAAMFSESGYEIATRTHTAMPNKGPRKQAAAQANGAEQPAKSRGPRARTEHQSAVGA